MHDDDAIALREALADRLPAGADLSTALEPITGDASTRRFFRVRSGSGSVLVAALYPETDRERAAHDLEVQRWAWERGLPVAEPVAVSGRVLMLEDLGDSGMAGVLRTDRDGALRAALDTCAAFQRCRWQDAPNPAFDAAFFGRELAGFVAATGLADEDGTVAYLDSLCVALASHPYRLAHRDFHADNLLARGGRMWAVDVQDLRGGPDTYDVVSLLRERGGADAVEDDAPWAERAAEALEWEPGWRRRYLECAAQRGLKVIGTFLRLAASGRTSYLDLLPPVRRRTAAALEALAAPAAVCAAAGGDAADPDAGAP